MNDEVVFPRRMKMNRVENEWQKESSLYSVPFFVGNSPLEKGLVIFHFIGMIGAIFRRIQMNTDVVSKRRKGSV